MIAARNVTAGRQSRLAVSAALAFAHQDAGFEGDLTSGNLDATDQLPAGACCSEVATPRRNGIRVLLADREGIAS